MIYNIFNPNENTVNYVCPDQATIDQGKAYGLSGIYSIGTEQEAQVILANNQKEWLANNLNLFSVNKDIDVTEGTQWIPCNLDQEPENDDMYYQVFTVINGSYQEAVGLVNAKTLLNQVKQNAKNFVIILSSFETWPTPPSPTLSVGVQTI